MAWRDQIATNEIFSRKTIDRILMYLLLLYRCQKSKSDINILMKYWRLKNTEISLAMSHFWL